MSEKLAIDGGSPVISWPFPKFQTFDHHEEAAVLDVIKSGVLSEFLGTKSPQFKGGPKVLDFESACCDFFQVEHAVTVNSWTSGLIAALGAVGLEPGDEVIVSPWTMSASATAILHWNAIPVFADIELDYYCIDPDSVEANISPRTRAILAVDIFGHPANMTTLRRIADKYDLVIISDTAQAPGALYKGQYAGTLADVGGFSLNYHKHIHTGEGGILVTNDNVLAEKLRLLRNHAEAVVDDNVSLLANMLGFNFRLGEIECAIGIQQLQKLPDIVVRRQYLGNRLICLLSDLVGLKLPQIEVGCTHVFYNFPMQLDSEILPISRDKIADMLVAEGVPVAKRYQNLHLLPLYQRKIAYGSNGFPWNQPFVSRQVDYDKGICPRAERLQDQTYLGLGLCTYDYRDEDLEAISYAFHKVWNALLGD